MFWPSDSDAGTVFYVGFDSVKYLCHRPHPSGKSWHKGEYSVLILQRPYATATSGWRHQMETSSALLAICAGNSPVTSGFPTQKTVTRSFDIFFDLRINVWVNNGVAGDLRCHRAHYDVTVMNFKRSWQGPTPNNLPGLY